MSISRCSYKSVQNQVLAFTGQVTADLSAGQLAQVNAFINTRLRDWAWIGWPWSELVEVELRQYRLPYASGTAYAAPTLTSASEVYFPATRGYYQALRATTGNAPATLVSEVWTTNSAYWAPCTGPYNASDWADATAYAVADQVRNPDDGRFYQCHTAHTSSSSLDQTKFGVLTDFDPYVSRTQTGQTVIGDYLGLYLENPLAVDRARRVTYRTSGLGAHVVASPTGRWSRGLTDYLVPHQVWVRFRIPCPEFTGATFDADATYTADVDKVYFAGSTTDLEGDYWLCIDDTIAGESPESAPAKWSRLEFPSWLRTPVARRAYADWLRNGAAREAARAEDASAEDALFLAQVNDGAMQGQVQRWRKNF